MEKFTEVGQELDADGNGEVTLADFNAWCDQSGACDTGASAK